MNQFILNMSLPIIIAALLIFIVAGFIWLFFGHGIDKIKNPREWRNKGASGERATYLALTQKYHIPENQIVRNALIPTKSGKAEIDIIVVSKKGLLVFECKNYSGNIYGDGSKKNWIQYVGNKKSYFYSPILQNRGHIKALKEYFKNLQDLPIIPFMVTTRNANWKLKNIPTEDHVIGWTDAKFKEIYDSLPNSDVITKNFNSIIKSLKNHENPNR